MDFAGTRRTASPTATAQTPPMPMPTRTRATTMVPKSGAQAAPRLPTTSTATSTHRAVRRSARPSSGTRAGAESAATRPVMVSVRPATPSGTPSERPIGVSSPTGSISDVTTVNVPSARAATPGQPLREDAGRAARASEDS